MKQLVHAFVISRLDYYNSILAGLPKDLISQLQRVQNSAARLVLGLQPRDHIKPALLELHWLPVHLRIEYKLCLLMHSVSVQCCPSYISDMVQTTAASSRRQGLHSSMDTFSYAVPPTVTKFGERAFSVAGPSVWNSLPSDIRHITDTSDFKRHRKAHFFTCILILSCFIFHALNVYVLVIPGYIMNSVICQWTVFCN